MFEDILKQLDLNESEAAVYESLVLKGVQTAPSIAGNTKITRTNTYNVLNALKHLGLIEELKHGKKTMFEAIHPNRLLDLLDSKKKKLLNAESTLDALLPKITSAYNLSSGKPGIRFFEGKAGVKEALFDSLESKTVVYGYMDYVAVDTYIPEIIFEYATRRLKKKVKKQNIIFDTPALKSFKGPRFANTETKLLPTKSVDLFASMMNIYDDKITQLTLSGDNLLGIIIEDPHMYNLHKHIFETLWKFTKYSDYYLKDPEYK